jgi:hypothetical protein
LVFTIYDPDNLLLIQTLDTEISLYDAVDCSHPKASQCPVMAELRSSDGKIERLLWRNFLDMEGEILNLQILLPPSSINSPEQTLRMLSPAAATDP